WVHQGRLLPLLGDRGARLRLLDRRGGAARRPVFPERSRAAPCLCRSPDGGGLDARRDPGAGSDPRPVGTADGGGRDDPRPLLLPALPSSPGPLHRKRHVVRAMTTRRRPVGGQPLILHALTGLLLYASCTGAIMDLTFPVEEQPGMNGGGGG